MGRESGAASGKIRVGVVHEVRVLREGLALLLRQWPDFSVVEIQQLPADDPELDLVLLCSFGGGSGVGEEVRQAKRVSNNARLVVVGVSDSPAEILACIEAGASGYTPLDGSAEHLAETLRMVNAGETVCPPHISALLFQRIADLKSQVQPMADDRLSRLTRRELEILRLVSDGMSNKEIAVHLQLELQTVKNYVHSILEKMRVSNRREAASYFGSLPDFQLPSTRRRELTPA